jgi:N6-L-threonylcarbamoyladenine synthase
VAFALGRPFIGINHHEAHLYSPWINVLPASCRQNRLEPGSLNCQQDAGSTLMADFTAFQPNLSLIVSGGHTMLVLVESELKHRVLGGTIDDAAGECFDKTGKLMGLAYPAGPIIDRLAAEGNPKAYDFPRPLLNDPNDDFSFSGLKTSVRYFIRDHPTLLDDPQKIRDLSASVQAAIVEVLVKKTIRAAKREGVRCITASGGVTCNRGLRAELARACKKNGFTLRLAEKNLCTDNAAMIGILAERKLLQRAGGVPPTEPSVSSLDEEIKPGWALE